MVQRVMGHERPSTTLDLYTRRTDNSCCIVDALNDTDEVPDDEDPDGGPQPSTLRPDAMLRGMLREPADREKRHDQPCQPVAIERRRVRCRGGLVRRCNPGPRATASLAAGDTRWIVIG
jgi:hypothetical protein